MRRILLGFALGVISLTIITEPAQAHDTGTYWHAKYHVKQFQKRNQTLRVGINYYRDKNRSLSGLHKTPLERAIIPWVNLARCESGNRWYLNTGSFDGGIQFSPSTWRANGGEVFADFAWQATPLQQAAVGEKNLARYGRMQWPKCTRDGRW